MPDAPDFPFTFLRDLFDGVETPGDPASGDAGDDQFVAAHAAMLDATANVLAAMRELIQSAEDMVRLRRDRLTDVDAEPPVSPSAPPANGHRRHRIDFTD